MSYYYNELYYTLTILTLLMNIAVECGDPDPIENGSVDTSEGTTFGNVAVYSCDEGYKLDEKIQGAVEVVCLATKEWSDTAPICKRK